MNRNLDDLKFLGLFGIYKESFNILHSWGSIFGLITLAFVIPSSFFLLAYVNICTFVLFTININTEKLKSIGEHSSNEYYELKYDIFNEWVGLALFSVVYYSFYFFIFVLSSCAIVYTVACIYADIEISFGELMTMVPKVCKRSMLTFLWNFAIFMGYSLVCLIIVALVKILLPLDKLHVDMITLQTIALGIYMIGFLYINVLWQLSCVLPILEDNSGMQAITKSRNLIKGKMFGAAAIYLIVCTIIFILQLAFSVVVTEGENYSLSFRVFFGTFCFIFIVVLNLFELVRQPVIYFVCKSYHNENIDKLSLSKQLKVDMGEYVHISRSRGV